MTMRLMTRATLHEYIDQPRHAAAREPMLVWAAVLEHSTWTSLVDVKETFPATDHISGETVYFDIGGNKWRIVANVAFQPEIVFIKWIGTHAEYDRL
jgi:mRNA interferase HigB